MMCLQNLLFNFKLRASFNNLIMNKTIGWADHRGVFDLFAELRTRSLVQAKAWSQWVFGIDSRSLLLFRVGLSFIMLWDLIVRFPDISSFYTDQVLLPRAVMMEMLP